jgi:DNA repair protein RecN (Recombination protein N)
MLEHLRARNLGLIRDAEIDPGPGLTVITGETGAGKTLLLGALRLLLGENSDASVVGPFGDSAQADGLFVSEGELGVTRIVPASGRSRSYLDGTVASVEALAGRVGSLVEVVGQHDQLELKKPRHILSMVDSNLVGESRELLDSYHVAWRTLQERLEEAAKLGGSGAELARELDLLHHQNKEITEGGFAPGDDAVLEQKEKRLRNAAEIREHLAAAITAASSIDDASGELVSRMRKIESLDPGAGSLAAAAESLAISATDLNRELAGSVDDLEDDSGSLAVIEERLNLLGNLKRKYGKTVDEIIAFGSKAGERAIEVEGLLARAESINQEIEDARAIVDEQARALSMMRHTVADRISKEMMAHLGEIGLDSATVRIHFEDVEPGPSGADRVEIHFASHAGLQPGPLTKVASGGELSRLILAISLSTSTSDETTLVFDEVDTGIGGATALAMGRKLADLAVSRQVLCVTHLPQVAAFADTHYVIARTDEEASVARVSGTGRLEELSRMIAGLPESERGQQAAVELLELSGK